MKLAEKSITVSQMFFLVIQSVTGIGILSLPYDIYKVSKQDAWISILLGGFIVGIGVLIIWLLLHRFPGLDIYDIANKIAGKYIGNLIKIAYIIFFMYATLHLSLLFCSLVKAWIFSETPYWAIASATLSVCIYCATKKLKIIARFFTMISSLFIILLFLPSCTLKDISIVNILPIGIEGPANIIQGALRSLFAFDGVEILLIIFPYTFGSSLRKLKMSLLAVGIITLGYSYIAFICIAFFGPAIMKLIPQPILYTLKFQSFQIIERTDLLFFAIWTVSVAASIIIFLYGSAIGISNIYKKNNHSAFVPYIALIVFLCIICIPKNDNYLKVISKYYNVQIPFFIFVFPGLLLLSSFIFKKKGNSY